ncbi:MAG: hypothetical protein L3J33_05590 [Rhodobacteraceae bacterium]|nr:hypothetical protein [Paracoccaceae bacterium]
MRSDWALSNGQTNLSVYVFNDLNANGIYDLGDRSFADIAVAMAFEGSTKAAIRSNLNGFANFAASTSAEGVPISELGRYDFMVLVPPGWYISTENTNQIRDLMLVKGSNPGVGFARMLDPVGLVRHKFIRGTFAGDNTGLVQLMQGDAVIVTANLTPGQQFLWPVQPGEYRLVSETYSRDILVGNFPVDIGNIDQIVLADTIGQTIDFENMAPTGLQKAPNGYGGLNWFNLNILRANSDGNNIGYINGTTSGNHILYSSSGHPAEIYLDQPFDFISVNLSVAWPKAEGEEVVFEFYREETLIRRDSIGLSAYGVIAYQPRIAGITRVRLATKHNWQLVLDDLVVNTPD